MFIADIKRVVEQVSRDKGIDREVLINALEEAIKSAARKKFGNKIDIETHYNDKSGEIEVFQFKDVTEQVTEPDVEISLEEGRLLDPECEIGDSLGTKMDTATFGRIAAQSAKQVIIQKMKDAERDAVYSSYIDRKGEIINGIVQRFDRGDIIVNLGQTEGILPVREQIPRETYRRGDRIRAYILDILYETRGPQIVLSRTHTEFLINLFKTEVPEISEGIVQVMGAAREGGVRAKIAVASSDADIDPVGACVGMKGSRVQTVVQELRGEKIDIVPWHVDSAKYVCNALAPAEISRVIIDETNRAMEVIVPDEYLSIAIGKRGQNVRLASKLTQWRLDVKSESDYNQAMQEGYDSLVGLDGVSIGLADALYELGFYSIEELASASPEDLSSIRDIDQNQAMELIESANEAIERLEMEAEAEKDEPADVELESASGESPMNPGDETGLDSDAEAASEAADQTGTDPDVETAGETAEQTRPEPDAETAGEGADPKGPGPDIDPADESANQPPEADPRAVEGPIEVRDQ